MPVSPRLWDKTTTGQAELRDLQDVIVNVGVGPQGPPGATGPQGPPGTNGLNGSVTIYQQAAEPVGAALGSIWITSEAPPVAIGTKPLIYDDLT